MLLGTGRTPTTLILLFWQWLTVSLVFMSSTSQISLTVFVDVKHRVYLVYLSLQ